MSEYVNDENITEYTEEMQDYLGNRSIPETTPKTYTITTSVENGTYTGSTSINEDGVAQVTISANSDSTNPDGVVVIGAHYSLYTKSTGVVKLGNPFGNIRIYAKCIKHPCLTFSSSSSFSLAVNNATKNWDGTLEYSTNDTTWTTWDGTTTISSSNTGKLYLRGTNNTLITGNVDAAYWTFPTGNNISISGNLETLLDYTSVENEMHPTMADYAFRRWMYQNTALVDCSELILGTPNLTERCYYSMFYDCSYLVNPPVSRALDTASYCCAYMFGNCTRLTTAMNISTKRYYSYCFYYMYTNCTALTSVPAGLCAQDQIPNTYCFFYMFNGCTNLVTLPRIYVSNYPDYSFSRMFNGCTKIKLSTTKVDEYTTSYSASGYYYTDWAKDMFAGTGGTFTGAMAIGTTYYTSNTLVS